MATAARCQLPLPRFPSAGSRTIGAPPLGSRTTSSLKCRRRLGRSCRCGSRRAPRPEGRDRRRSNLGEVRAVGMVTTTQPRSDPPIGTPPRRVGDPSGDQDGEYSWAALRETFVTPVPSMDTMKMSAWSSVKAAVARRLPSGDQSGHRNVPLSDDRRRSFVPSGRTTRRVPLASLWNAMTSPFGDHAGSMPRRADR